MKTSLFTFTIVAAFIVSLLSVIVAAEPPQKSQPVARSCDLAIDEQGQTVPEKEPVAKENDAKKQKWIKLFDGKTTKGWKTTKFGGEGEVEVKDGLLTVGIGNPLSGVTSTHKDLPKINYELRLETQRMMGSDFFCGLTFPVKDKCCSLILGGWGGGVIGISSIDGFDAAENETTDYRAFKSKQWYKVRLIVTEKKLLAWLDKDEIVDVDLEDKKLSVRVEVELSKPLGLATFETQAGYRNIEIRKLSDKEVKSINAKKD